MLAVVVALAVLALPGETRAQTSNGGGIRGFLDNMFTGSLAKGGQGASQAPRGGWLATSAPAGAAREFGCIALEWRGWRIGPSSDDRERDPRGRREFPELRCGHVARRSTPSGYT